jgi:RHS repeat-associated protein
MENDNEVHGEGGWQDYGLRMYDPRIARFPSVDPLTAYYPWYTPYQFAGNNPIRYIDLDGLEWYKNTWEATKSGYNNAVKTVDETYTATVSTITNTYEKAKQVTAQKVKGAKVAYKEAKKETATFMKENRGNINHISESIDLAGNIMNCR